MLLTSVLEVLSFREDIASSERLRKTTKTTAYRFQLDTKSKNGLLTCMHVIQTTIRRLTVDRCFALCIYRAS